MQCTSRAQTAVLLSQSRSIPPLILSQRLKIIPKLTHSLQPRNLHDNLAQSNLGRASRPLYDDIRYSSELGLRSKVPPDMLVPKSDNEGGKKDRHNSEDEVSDQEWEIQTGRAIYTLQQTLPDFFKTGLITSLKEDSLQAANSSRTTQHLAQEQQHSIYSPKIRLAYTPPVVLPQPFPRTLRVEGLPLYMASSVFIRHTLNALYSDLNLEMRRFVAQSSSSSPRSALGDMGDGASMQGAGRKDREKSVVIGFRVTGTARVSGGRGEWDVTSTYTFSPLTGLILAHVIDSINPAPHQAVYDAMRASLVKVLGLSLVGGAEGGATGRPGGASAAFEGVEGRSDRK